MKFSLIVYLRTTLNHIFWTKWKDARLEEIFEKYNKSKADNDGVALYWMQDRLFQEMFELMI